MTTSKMMARILGMVGLVGAIACGCTDWDYEFCQDCAEAGKTAYQCNYSVDELYYDTDDGLWKTANRSYRLTGCYADADEMTKACTDACEGFQACHRVDVTEFYCDGIDDCEPSNADATATAGATGTPSCGDWAPADAIAIDPASGGRTINRGFWAGLLSDVSQVTCDATLVVPTIGGTPGYSLANVDPGSFADALGLQDGDVLVSLNGQPLTTAVDIRDAVVGLSSTQTFQLAIVRSGANMVLQYTVQ